MTQNKKIAVTGGIGSGKSSVCMLLKEWGYPVFSCDEISRNLWNDGRYLNLLAETFPNCLTDGIIDKKKVSALVFSDSSARRTLEAISHPLILQTLFGEMEKHNPAFAEVPLLFEVGLQNEFDAVLLVKRDKEERISSVMARDGCTREEVERRLSAQFTDAERTGPRVTVVENNGDLNRLRENLIAALQSLGL